MAAASRRILFTEPFDESVLTRVRFVGEVVQLNRCDEGTLQEAVGDFDALVVRTSARVTSRVLQAASRLQVIGRAGVGLDNIDVEDAKSRGIRVVYTPDASTEAVADLTLGLLIALERKLMTADFELRQGRFVQARTACIGRELSELSMGIVGLGRIGKAVARRCHFGFGMKVLYHDIVDPGPLDFPAERLALADLCARADVVSLHVPGTEGTVGLVDQAMLARFKKGSLLINTSRGAVVDANALVEGLRRGIPAGAALDVFEPEPLPANHPLLSAPNTLFTPHLGARTRAAMARMNAVVEDVIRVLQDEAPRYPAWV